MPSLCTRIMWRVLVWGPRGSTSVAKNLFINKFFFSKYEQHLKCLLLFVTVTAKFSMLTSKNRLEYFPYYYITYLLILRETFWQVTNYISIVSYNLSFWNEKSASSIPWFAEISATIHRQLQFGLNKVCPNSHPAGCAKYRHSQATAALQEWALAKITTKFISFTYLYTDLLAPQRNSRTLKGRIRLKPSPWGCGCDLLSLKKYNPLLLFYYKFQVLVEIEVLIWRFKS